MKKFITLFAIISGFLISILFSQGFSNVTHDGDSQPLAISNVPFLLSQNSHYLPVPLYDTHIALGETVYGSLDIQDPQLSAAQFFDVYTFTGQEGQEILINLSTLEFDAFLGLLNSAGELITIDDDTGDAMGSVISNFVLPTTGTYTIVVTSHDAEEVGHYVLNLNEAPWIDYLGDYPQEILIGEHVKGELTPVSLQLSTGQFYDAYRFEARYGQAMAIVMRSEQLNAYLLLLDHEGRVITANNDDQGQAGGDSEIIFLPAVSGTYTVLAGSAIPLVGGTYELALERVSEPTVAEALVETVSGELSMSDFQLSSGQYLDVYVLEGEAGESVTIGLVSSDFDSYVRILDSNGQVLKQNDDASGGKDALIAGFVLPKTGQYYVWVSSVFAGEMGNYILSLNDESLQSLRIRGNTDSKEGIKISLGDKKVCEDCIEENEISLRKGGTFENASWCAGSEKKYTAKVKVCSSVSSTGKVFLASDQPKITIDRLKGIDFTVDPNINNGCTTVGTFTLTATSDTPAGQHTITATTNPNIGSDSEVVNVVGVNITSADICTDKITTQLSPNNKTGRFQLELITNTKLTSLTSENRKGDTYHDSFNVPNLAEDLFTKIKATWTIDGLTCEGTFNYKFQNLGQYRHSQYNTPNEAHQTCNSALVNACFTNQSCSYSKKILKSKFQNKVDLNGSGKSINHGNIQPEAWCQNNGFPPPGECSNLNVYRANTTIAPSCKTPNNSLGDTTVAVGNNGPLSCGDKICIFGLGDGAGGTIKTVTDACPACTGKKQIDNYTTNGACSGIPDLGNFVTIKLP